MKSFYGFINRLNYGISADEKFFSYTIFRNYNIIFYGFFSLFCQNNCYLFTLVVVYKRNKGVTLGEMTCIQQKNVFLGSASLSKLKCTILKNFAMYFVIRHCPITKLSIEKQGIQNSTKTLHGQNSDGSITQIT